MSVTREVPEPESALDRWRQVGGEGSRITIFNEQLESLSVKLKAGEITEEGFLKGLEGDGKFFRTHISGVDETIPWRYIIERTEDGGEGLLVSSRQRGEFIPQVTAQIGLERGRLSVQRVDARFIDYKTAKFQDVIGVVLGDYQGEIVTRKQFGNNLLQALKNNFQPA